MCNCNQQRVLYTSAIPQQQRGMAKVKLTVNRPIMFNGNITGRLYEFKKINDIKLVDRRDLAGMENDNGLQVL